MPSRPDGLIRAFGMTGLQIATSMARIERRFGVELGWSGQGPTGRKTAEYEQFEATMRAEASRMSEFYEVFYCLENSIRNLISDMFLEAEGADWWRSARVDEKRIREPVAARRKKEVDSGITPDLINLLIILRSASSPSLSLIIGICSILYSTRRRPLATCPIN